VGKDITSYSYDVVKLRKDVAERLREFAERMGLSISDAIAYLLQSTSSSTTTNIVDQVMTEVTDYVVRNFDKTRAKLTIYPGGDYFIFDQLNRFFNLAKASVFVEVFGGSCWCSLNVSRSRFKVIVCNDIDQDLITFYKLVKEKPEELVKRVSVLPFSRELLDIAMEVLNDKTADPVTRAIMLFYVFKASFNAKGTSFRVTKAKNNARTYANTVASIVEYAKRFRDVVLECRDFRDVINLYDSSDTLFYLDPPYVGRVGYYRYSFTYADLKNMAVVLRSVKGSWILKIAEDNYRVIKDILSQHEIGEVRSPMYMVKAMDGEERPELIYLIAHNIKTPKLG